ncbi:hypothetical protein Mapa_017366 [Marchantia paleacea]|nr:hypothetical protein Mapa_017366 [Marchantia paleacea]
MRREIEARPTGAKIMDEEENLPAARESNHGHVVLEAETVATPHLETLFLPTLTDANDLGKSGGLPWECALTEAFRGGGFSAITGSFAKPTGWQCTTARLQAAIARWKPHCPPTLCSPAQDGR